VRAELNDSPTARAIEQALPIEASAKTWGDEVYFSIPAACEASDDARADVVVGELGYWPAGNAFCVFFGATPASGADGRPRAAGKVNPIGKVLDEATVLRAVADGQAITIAAGE